MASACRQLSHRVCQAFDSIDQAKSQFRLSGRDKFRLYEEFLWQARSEKKLMDNVSSRLIKFFLCGFREECLVRDRTKEGDKIYKFNAKAEFPQICGMPLSRSILEPLQRIVDCMVMIPATKFACNMQPYIFDGIVNDNAKLYESEYDSIVEFLGDFDIHRNVNDFMKEKKEVVIKDARSKKLIEVKYPNNIPLRLHLAKHCAKLLVDQGVFPLYGKEKYHNYFSINTLFNVFSCLRDYPRKQTEQRKRYDSHNEQIDNKRNNLQAYCREQQEFESLLKSDDYSLGHHFYDNWDGFREDLIEGREPRLGGYPVYILDFLKNNPCLWEGDIEDEDPFSKMLELHFLLKKDVKRFAVQPLFCNSDIVYGNNMHRAAIINLEGDKDHCQSLYMNVEIFPDGKTPKSHVVKMHIPSKYRCPEYKKGERVKVQDDNSGSENKKKDKPEGDLKRDFTYDFSYIDEKDFKKYGKKGKITKAKLMSVFLREKASKRVWRNKEGGKRVKKSERRSQKYLYMYPIMNMDWCSINSVDEKGDRIGQETRDKNIAKVVKELGNDEQVAVADLGINELFHVMFCQKSPNHNDEFFKRPKMNVVYNDNFKRDELLPKNTEFKRKMDRTWEIVREISKWRKAFRTFEFRPENLRDRKVMEELWEKIDNGEMTQAKLVGKYHALANKYKSAFHEKLGFKDGEWVGFTGVTLWEKFQWIKLTKRVKSLLKSQAMKGEKIKRGEVIDYTGRVFGNIVSRLEGTYANQKMAFVRELASYVARQLHATGTKHLFLENLRLFRMEARRKRSSNELLGLWSHRNLVEKIKMACDEYGIMVYDWVDPRYSSQINPYTGNWMYRPMGSKVAWDEFGKEHDADEIGAMNLMRRVFSGKGDSDMSIRIRLGKDRVTGMHEDSGRKYAKCDGVWRSYRGNVEFGTKKRELRLYKHGSNYLDYMSHRKIVACYKSQESDVQHALST